jgi:adenylyltransferase/sulfurtransferase
LRKNARCAVCGDEPTVTRLIDYEGFCYPMNVLMDMTARELSECLDDVFLLDVREPGEWDAGHVEQARHIPLGQLPQRLEEVPRDADVVVTCRSGGRSARAVAFLRQQGFTRVKNLAGGMLAYSREVDPGIRVV